MARLNITESLKFFNPFQYKKLIRHHSKTLFKSYFIFLLLSIVLFAIVLFPKVLMVGHNVNNAVDKFNTFEVDIDSDLSEPAVFNSMPKMQVNFNPESENTEGILITKDDVYVNIWPFNKHAELDEYKDLRNRSSDLSGLISLIAILVYPGILIAFGLLNLIESLLIAIVFSCLAFIIIRTIKKDIKFSRLFKIALMSTPILFIFNAIFITFLLNIWFPMIIHFLFFVAAAIIASHKIGSSESASSEPKEKKSKKKKKESENSGPIIAKSRNKEIFGDKKSKRPSFNLFKKSDKKKKSKSSKASDDDFIMLD